jgi:L-threonylcarbamoyladenylate synthase
LDTIIIQANSESIDQAASIVRGGGLVIFPTETVYGLGANAWNEGAVAKIFAAKGRPQDNPLIAHIAEMDDLGTLVSSIPESAKRLAERFWPGPLTMVLPTSGGVPDAVTAGLDTVAVRMPSHPVARALILAAGVPIAAPSANLSGSPSPTRLTHCAADMDGRVDMILDGGSCDVGLESTVVTLAGDVPRLLRPGGVTLEQLLEVLGTVEADEAVFGKADEAKPVASPGMKYKHYAPKAELTLVYGGKEAFAKYVADHKDDGTAALVFDGEFTEEALGVPLVTYGKESDAAAQAERLFAALRELDEIGAKTAYARAPSADGVGLAVYNRLMRAAAFREIKLNDE